MTHKKILLRWIDSIRSHGGFLQVSGATGVSVECDEGLLWVRWAEPKKPTLLGYADGADESFRDYYRVHTIKWTDYEGGTGTTHLETLREASEKIGLPYPSVG